MQEAVTTGIQDFSPTALAIGHPAREHAPNKQESNGRREGHG